jgi:hypothetical protein
MRGPCGVCITWAVTHLITVPGGWPASSCSSKVACSAPTAFSSGAGGDAGVTCCCDGASTVEGVVEAAV